MSAKNVIQIEYLDSERILSEFKKLSEQLAMLTKKQKVSNTENSVKPYYDRKEVKEMLGVSYPILNSWAKKRILKPRRLGSRLIYRAIDIEEALIPMQSKK